MFVPSFTEFGNSILALALLHVGLGVVFVGLSSWQYFLGLVRYLDQVSLTFCKLISVFGNTTLELSGEPQGGPFQYHGEPHNMGWALMWGTAHVTVSNHHSLIKLLGTAYGTDTERLHGWDWAGVLLFNLFCKFGIYQT